MDLLQDAHQVADLAFVRGVYVYSQFVGPDAYPDGIFEREGVPFDRAVELSEAGGGESGDLLPAPPAVPAPPNPPISGTAAGEPTPPSGLARRRGLASPPGAAAAGSSDVRLAAPRPRPRSATAARVAVSTSSAASAVAPPPARAAGPLASPPGAAVVGSSGVRLAAPRPQPLAATAARVRAVRPCRPCSERLAAEPGPAASAVAPPPARAARPCSERPRKGRKGHPKLVAQIGEIQN